MNSYSKESLPSPRESSPTSIKESSPSTNESPAEKGNIKLKRSSPVLTKKLSSPFPYAKKMESPKRTFALPSPDLQVTYEEQQRTEQQRTEPSTSKEASYVPIKDVSNSDDELHTSEIKVNRKRSTLSKQLSTSADNVLNIEDDVSPSTNLLTTSKKKASRSKSSENLSLFHGRGISIRRSGRRKANVSNDSPKSPPPNDSNRLLTLAQGILNNLRIPGFGRQQSGSEPPLRSSWCLKVYDGTHDLEQCTTAKQNSSVQLESPTKPDQQAGMKSEESGKRHRNSKLHDLWKLPMS